MRDKEEGCGLLYPDAFSEEYLIFILPATSALLVIFSRINCGHFISLIFGDYVAGLLGLPRERNMEHESPITTKKSEKISRGSGNQVSVEFNLLYRWRATTAKEDIQWTEDEFASIFSDNSKVAAITAFHKVDPKSRQRVFGGDNMFYSTLENFAGLCPLLRGNITINGTNPLDPPLFNPNYFSHPQDIAIMQYAVESAKKLVAAAAWDGYILGVTANLTENFDPSGGEDVCVAGNLQIGQVTAFAVLDLGAGMGTLRIVVAKLLKALVPTIVATDYQPDLLVNLSANVQTNYPYKPFDIILAADVIYHALHAEWIRGCVEQLLAPNGTFWLMIPLRSTGQHEGMDHTVEAVSPPSPRCIWAGGFGEENYRQEQCDTPRETIPLNTSSTVSYLPERRLHLAAHRRGGRAVLPGLQLKKGPGVGEEGEVAWRRHWDLLPRDHGWEWEEHRDVGDADTLVESIGGAETCAGVV
ncbi:hypothetical protein EDD18DRAFT_1351955 [Armillaria luteobubalina]|uniref:Glucose-methanol-choline oxidoreductase C-terminal domain-containing protein n=1 Tax=Armillaria luteobubalina TaxID=153913 RepID=A0AA39Q8I2_9AGAR|nr:hypothetical protein EDD18DRAFT_1351955 [Armillaria luteobubalina]